MSEPMAGTNRDLGKSGGVEPGTASAYEPPRLVAIGNLHDLLAGTGTNPCDGSTIATGPTLASGPIGTGDQCGPSG
jgi:hypothetical protein